MTDEGYRAAFAIVGEDHDATTRTRTSRVRYELGDADGRQDLERGGSHPLARDDIWRDPYDAVVLGPHRR